MSAPRISEILERHENFLSTECRMYAQPGNPNLEIVLDQIPPWERYRSLNHANIDP
jgi:hypothetical protein